MNLPSLSLQSVVVAVVFVAAAVSSAGWETCFEVGLGLSLGQQTRTVA